MDPTVLGEEGATAREGDIDKESSYNDSVPAFTILRDSKTKLRKELRQ